MRRVPRECKAVRADGAPCESPFVGDNGFCAAHGPGGSVRMAARGLRGAEATIRKLEARGVVKPGEAPEPPQTIDDARVIAAWAMRAVMVGQLDPRVAQQVTALLREFRSAVKESAMEAELAELRATVAALKAKKKGGTR